MSTLLLAALLAAKAADAVVIGTLGDPLTLEPHRATDLLSSLILANVCEPLVRLRDDAAHYDSGLAMAWATTDGRSWTFTLRPGVRFHDGAAFDADAVVANFEHLRRVRGFAGRAERAGPLLVSVTLDRPNAALLATLSQPFFAMQSPASLEPSAAPASGTGPFRLAAFRPGQVELEASPAYWGGGPRLARLVFRRYPGEQALEAALLGGEVDVTSAIPQRRLGELRGKPGIVLVGRTGLNLTYLSLNNERRPFDNRGVRQAVARAVDRAALVASQLAGHGEPARNPLPPSLAGYASATKELRLERPAARHLLAAAGLGSGFETTLMTVDAPRPYMAAPLQLAAEIRAALAEVGIRARVQQARSWAEYVERGSQGDYDMAVFGWQADSADPNDFLSALLGSDSIGTTNRSRYRSSAMEALLKRGRAGRGAEERAAAYREAQALFQKEMPFVPLYHVSVFVAHRTSVGGLQVGATGIPRYEKAWKTGER